MKLLGEVPQGLPALGLPAIQWADLNELLPLAFACFLLGAVETAAIGRMFTRQARRPARRQPGIPRARRGESRRRARPRLSRQRRHVAIARQRRRRRAHAALGRVRRRDHPGGGAFLLAPAARLPQPVLAAIVLVAVAGLFKVSTLKQLWRGDRPEFVVAMAALVGVLGSGLLRGVLIGAIISLVLLIRRASRPHVAFLGRIPGTRRFSDRERHPDNELIPGVLIFRPESGLVYFNVDHVCDTILDRVRAEATPPKLVVLDLSAAPRVDMQSAHTLAGLADELTAAGIRVQVVEARSSVRERLRGEGWTTSSAASIASLPSPERWTTFSKQH